MYNPDSPSDTDRMARENDMALARPTESKTGTYRVTVKQIREVTFEIKTDENDLEKDAKTLAVMNDEWDDVVTSVTFHEFLDGFTPEGDDL